MRSWERVLWRHLTPATWKHIMYSGADFPAELLVFSGINSSQMDIFLAEYKKAGIEPIGCKAVVTQDNVFWSADKLFREIFKEHLFMSR